jgi:hypothetical protein
VSKYVPRTKPLPLPGQVWSRLSNSFSTNRREVFRVLSLDTSRKVAQVVFLDDDRKEGDQGTVSLSVFVKTQRGIRREEEVCSTPS